MSLRKSLTAVLKENNLAKAENPKDYAKLANEGLLLGYPVKINGSHHRPDNGIKYHSTIKFFNREKDDPKDVHKIASKMGPHKPHPEEVGITPDKIKSRAGGDIYVIKLHGHHADQIKERHKQFGHMGHKENYEFHPHISVDKETHDRIKASGAKTAHEAGIEFGHPELKHGPKTLHSYEPKVKKSEQSEAPPLTKPYSSEAQRRWAHTETGKKALGGNAGVHEWDEATKGKKLPEKVGKAEELEKGALKNAVVGGAMLLGSHAHAASEHLHQYVSGMKNLPGVKVESTFAPNGKGSKDGKGEYRVKIGNYTIEGQHYSINGNNNHKTSMSGPKNPSPKDKEDESKAKFLRQKLTTTGQDLLDKSLEKGAVKNALTGAAMATALASPQSTGAKQHAVPTRAPAGVTAPKHSDYSREKVLNAISQVESSGGKNTHHKATSMGTAYGKFAIMPDVVHDTIRLNPDLKRQHQKAMNLNGKDLHHYLQDNPKLEQEIVNRHLSRLEHHFGQDPDKLSYAWNHGILGTNRALKQKQNISSHPYVQKFKHAYKGSK